MNTYNNELCHFGIKGMKWGVRRTPAQLGRGKRSRKSRVDDRSEDARVAASLRKKKVSQMSNAELRKLNERTQLEQQYSRLHPTTIRKGMKVVAATAATMGTVMNLYNNSDKIVKLGQRVGGKIVDFAGDMVMNDLNKHL